MGSNLPHLMLF